MNSPSLAQSVFQLISVNNTGYLATMSIKHPGFPYASVVPFAFSSDGEILFFMSSMATHTRNLKSDPKASLLVTAPSDDPQATGRVTIVGNVEVLADNKVEQAKSTYLDTHPQAQQWASFGDFTMYRMKAIDIYIVAGFGAMGWVSPDELKRQIGNG